MKEELPEGDNEMQEENTDNDAKSKGEEPSDNASKTKEKEVKISDKEDHAIANEQNKLEDHMSKQSIEDDIEDAVVMCGSKDRVEDGQSAFSVSPKEAVLPAGGNMEFVITFAPPKVCTRIDSVNERDDERLFIQHCDHKKHFLKSLFRT